MGGKVCLRCKGKTLLGLVNKLFAFKTTQCFAFTLSRPKFEFSLKVKMMRSNPGYLLLNLFTFNVDDFLPESESDSIDDSDDSVETGGS